MENSNLPAFPAHDGDYYYGGLTKREHFACLIIQGLCSNPDVHAKNVDVAKTSISLADELLKQLESK